MIAKLSSATVLNGSENFQVLFCNPASAIFDKLFPDGADYIGHFERRPFHLFFWIVFLYGKIQRVKRADSCVQAPF
jgi:hypothetical protein